MASEEDRETCDYANISDSSSIASSEPERLNVLPPDHPLLQRFQQSLKEHLLRTKNKLENEIEDIKFEIKAKEQTREDQGIALYDMQQKLSFQEEQIQEISTQVEEHIESRIKEENAVAELKKEYEEEEANTKEKKVGYQKLMTELEDLQSLGGNIKKWVNEVEDEVKNAKRIVSRDAQLQKQLSEEKRKSDILFYRLDMEVKKRELELENICEEEAAMKEVINIINMSIADANTDLSALENEHKRLTQAWGEVIIAIQLRDKILFQVQDNIRKQKESIKLSTTGIEAIKKQINKELDLNRKLENFKQRLAADTLSLKRDCQKEHDTLMELQRKLDGMPEFLARTEADLHEANCEGTKIMSEIRRLDTTLDKYHQKKFQIEESILKLAQEQLTTDKASAYRLKLLNKAQDRRRSLDVSLSKAQNQLASACLDVEKLRNNLFNIRKDNDNTKTQLDEAEKKVDELDGELKKMETQMELKMKRFEKVNNQLEEIIRKQGDEATSPMEIKIKQLEKLVSAGEQSIRSSQEFWVMLQNHYVNLSQKRSRQLNEIQITRKQLSIIKQKNLKIEQDLEEAEDKNKELSAEVEKITAKLEVLNQKIFKDRVHQLNDQTDYEHEQAESSQKLKDTEMCLLKMEDDINELHKEINLNKDLVLDYHRESLSWETKYKQIEEVIRWSKTEHALDSDLGAMKTEIHRMEIRYNQLKRAQEKLVQDLEHCVMHREQIFVSATVKDHVIAKMKSLQGSSSIQVKLDDLRNKSKSVKNELKFLSEKKIPEDVYAIERLQFMLTKVENDLKDVGNADAAVQAQIEECLLLKHANLEHIVRKQYRAKAYRRLNNSKTQHKLVRSPAQIQAQSQKQNEMNELLMDVIQTLMADYPEKKSFFTKLIHVLKE